MLGLAFGVAVVPSLVGIWGLLSGGRWWRRNRDTAVNLLLIGAGVIVLGLVATVIL